MKRKLSANDDIMSLLGEMASGMYGAKTEVAAPIAAVNKPLIFPELEAQRLRSARRLCGLFKEECGDIFAGTRWVRHLEAWLWSGRNGCKGTPTDPIFPSKIALRHANRDLKNKLVNGGRAPHLAKQTCTRLTSVCASLGDEAEELQRRLRLTEGSAIGKARSNASVGGRSRIMTTWLEVPVTFDGSKPQGMSDDDTDMHQKKKKHIKKKQTKKIHGSDEQQLGSEPAAMKADTKKVHGRKLCLTYKKAVVEVRIEHYCKLLALLRAAAGEGTDASSALFSAMERTDWQVPPLATAAEQEAIYCCLARYCAASGGHYRGGSDQAAAPEEVFECLNDSLGVHMELFASPLNVSLALARQWANADPSAESSPLFCGAFQDIDVLFGGFSSSSSSSHDVTSTNVGFFRYDIPRDQGGSFWVNPPFEDDILERVALRLRQVLDDHDAAASTHVAPLSFIVILPHCPEKAHHQALLSIPHLEHHMVLAQVDHVFYVGAQHSASTKQQLTVRRESRHSSREGKQSVAKLLHTLKKNANHDSSIFFFRNTTARERWPLSKSVKEQLKKAFQMEDNDNDDDDHEIQ